MNTFPYSWRKQVTLKRRQASTSYQTSLSSSLSLPWKASTSHEVQMFHNQEPKRYLVTKNISKGSCKQDWQVDIHRSGTKPDGKSATWNTEDTQANINIGFPKFVSMGCRSYPAVWFRVSGLKKFSMRTCEWRNESAMAYVHTPFRISLKEPNDWPVTELLYVNHGFPALYEAGYGNLRSIILYGDELHKLYS